MHPVAERGRCAVCSGILPNGHVWFFQTFFSKKKKTVMYGLVASEAHLMRKPV
jgi:hypothetical protein